MIADVNTLAGVEIVFQDTLLISLDKTLAKVYVPGNHLVITPLIIAASLTPTGTSWLQRLDDSAAQIAEWGNVAFVRA
jgi:hypothetical protein